MEPIANESMKELKKLFSWFHAREAHLESPISILVGGWAVYSYNRYWGSVDIDIITNSKTKRSLKYFLISREGYETDPLTGNSVIKRTPNGEVVIDIANREGDRFEGSPKKFDLGIIDGNTETRTIEDQEVIVPSITILIMMKFKAAWDRRWRINNNKSQNPNHDRFKLIKDHSDIIALIDSGEEFDIRQLGRFFSKYPFVTRVFDDILSSDSASEKYGISMEEMDIFVNKLRSLVVDHTMNG